MVTIHIHIGPKLIENKAGLLMRSMLSGNILYKYSVFYKHETFKRRPNDKRTINTKDKSFEIQTYLFIIREFKHNNNDFKKGLAQSERIALARKDSNKIIVKL